MNEVNMRAKKILILPVKKSREHGLVSHSWEHECEILVTAHRYKGSGKEVCCSQGRENLL